MANKKIPMRQCVGCRELKPKKDMIRVIKTAAEDEPPHRLYLMPRGGKTAEALMCVRTVSACARQ